MPYKTSYCAPAVKVTEFALRQIVATSPFGGEEPFEEIVMPDEQTDW